MQNDLSDSQARVGKIPGISTLALVLILVMLPVGAVAASKKGETDLYIGIGVTSTERKLSGLDLSLLFSFHAEIGLGFPLTSQTEIVARGSAHAGVEVVTVGSDFKVNLSPEKRPANLFGICGLGWAREVHDRGCHPSTVTDGIYLSVGGGVEVKVLSGTNIFFQLRLIYIPSRDFEDRKLRAFTLGLSF